MESETDKAFWRAFILRDRIIVNGPHEIGPAQWEATLSDGSMWVEFGECSLLPGLCGRG
jgi:hypothetical protein